MQLNLEKIKTQEQKNKMQKINEKEFILILSSANNFCAYQTHFLNLDFNIKDIMDKIKHTAKINLIRLSEFFEDFQPLRKGSCTKAKYLNAEEFDVL